MKCVRPLQAFYSVRDDGKKELKFRSGNRIEPNSGLFKSLDIIDIPCGQCINCRLQRAADWATRIMKHLCLCEHSSFVTLTYDDENITSDKSLCHSDFQKFMKRLRKANEKVHRNGSVGFDFGSFICHFDDVRYYMCGEYGEDLSRPHYHVIFCGLDFYDKKFYKMTKSGEKLFTSAVLEKLWGKGYCPIGNVTFDSAAYVARYCLKKVTGKGAEEHYGGLKAEYSACSHGIGKEFFKKFRDQIVNQDGVVVNGVMRTPPRYFDKLLAIDDEEKYCLVKQARIDRMLGHEDEFVSSRLRDEEIVQKAKFQLYSR